MAWERHLLPANVFRAAPSAACYPAPVNILLSHSVGPEDGPIASRLKAVTAAYGVRLLLPERKSGASRTVAASTRDAIKQADAVVALVTKGAADTDKVSGELSAALRAKKPIVAVVEGNVSLPSTSASVHVVRFNRDDPGAHEAGLVDALQSIAKARKTAKARAEAQQAAIAIGALVGIAVGLLALGAVALAAEPKEPQVSAG